MSTAVPPFSCVRSTEIIEVQTLGAFNTVTIACNSIAIQATA